ncbi:MAG TPA: uridine kinase [Bryobacteraceae bacterium]|nr:uridine kinase [Bryobacteraceae bacterium]
MRPHIIGIAGPSSSGKTEIARQVCHELSGASIVSLDSYYRDLKGMPFEERKKLNFDRPDALEWELLHQHLRALADGRAFEQPVYSFARHARTPETVRIEPSEFAIVEGLFVLYWPELRSVLDTKVYVRTDLDVCYRRRLARDVAERGRTPESVRQQYERTVRPNAERFVVPTIEYADLVVSGELPVADSTMAVLKSLRRVQAATGGA